MSSSRFYRGLYEATFALKAGLWFRRGRLDMLSPVIGIMPSSTAQPSIATDPKKLPMRTG